MCVWVCFVYDVEQEITGVFISYIKQIFYKQTRKHLVCMIIESFLKVSRNTFLGVLINIFFC